MQNIKSFSALLLILCFSLSNCDVENCQIPNPDGTCYQCVTGYNSINGGGCALADPNCASIYFSDGSCYQCSQGYSKTGTSNGRCVNSSKNCKTFQLDGNSCDSCYPGDCNSNGNCITGNSQCKTFTSTCSCDSCWWGTVNNGVCP